MPEFDCNSDGGNFGDTQKGGITKGGSAYKRLLHIFARSCANLRFSAGHFGRKKTYGKRTEKHKSAQKCKKNAPSCTDAYNTPVYYAPVIVHPRIPKAGIPKVGIPKTGAPKVRENPHWDSPRDRDSKARDAEVRDSLDRDSETRNSENGQIQGPLNSPEGPGIEKIHSRSNA